MTRAFVLLAALLPTVGAAAAAAPLCPHTYFPMEEGLTLTYRLGAKTEATVKWVGVKKTKDGLKATLQFESGEKRGEAVVLCGPQGITTSVGGLEGAALQGSGLDVKITANEGVVLPPVSALKPEDAWSGRLTADIVPPTGKSGVKTSIHTEFVKQSTVVGDERVTVGAGQYTGLKVKNLTTASSGKVGSERSVTSLLWFAPNVGLVKVMTEGHVDLELLKVERAKAARR